MKIDILKNLNWNKQWSIKEDITFNGIGLHKGKPVTVTFKPAPIDTGIIFIRNDLETPVYIPALCEYISETTNLCTILSNEEKSLWTIEHCLSAIYGLGISNIFVEVNGEELPALDGSSLIFCDYLIKAGIIEQDSSREFITLPKVFWISDDDKHIIASPNDYLQITYGIDFCHPMVGKQLYQIMVTPFYFYTQIAPARTFGFRQDIEFLYNRGLALGGSYDNAIIVDLDGYSSPLRFNNELVRHKILDLIGDIALIGGNLLSSLIAIKAGHHLHNKLVKHIYINLY